MVTTQGSITLPAKKLNEIISKLPDQPINFSLDTETNKTEIKCGNSKFDLLGIASTEFPNVVENELISDSADSIDIEITPFLKAIKQTVFAAAVYDSNNVLSGVYCNISDNKLEMAATDGNRLSRAIENINNEDNKDYSVVIPSKTLNELSKLITGSSEDKLSIVVKNGQIAFRLKDRYLTSRLLDGQYPKYQQLIPQSSEKKAVIDREAFVASLDRASVMVNERTSIVKFTFDDNKVLLKSDTPDFGDSMELLEAEFTDDELIIAFNYKYVLEALKIMESEKVRVELGGSLSATMFKPESEDDYLCLIMPVQIR